MPHCSCSSSQSFLYRDPACYTFNLNHAVVVVGYLLDGTDPAAPGLPPPYWIIRNSWGAQWGEGGYMRMAMQGGDGICGINTLPALVPVIKSEWEPGGMVSRRLRRSGARWDSARVHGRAER